MSSRELTAGRTFLVRAKHDSDIIGFLTETAKRNAITTATFTAIGALRKAKIGFYNQTTHEYSEILLEAPQEIATCTGNISLKEDEPFVHAHAVLADHDGSTKAGHLLEGQVFAAEVHLTELVGEKTVRKNDVLTGLSLWDI